VARVRTALWVLMGWLVLAGLLAPRVGRALRDRRAREVLRDQRERLDRGENVDRSDSQVPQVKPGRLDRKARKEWQDRQDWLATMERADHLARKAFLAPQDPKGHQRPN
jgi:hypothetical protein